MTARVETRTTDGGQVVVGWGCPRGCVASASFLAVCPQCGVRAERVEYGPDGVLWSKTTIRIPSGVYPADRTIGYVDLDGGARVLCELADVDEQVGGRVRLDHRSAQGDPVAVTA